MTRFERVAGLVAVAAVEYVDCRSKTRMRACYGVDCKIARSVAIATITSGAGSGGLRAAYGGYCNLLDWRAISGNACHWEDKGPLRRLARLTLKRCMGVIKLSAVGLEYIYLQDDEYSVSNGDRAMYFIDAAPVALIAPREPPPYVDLFRIREANSAMMDWHYFAPGAHIAHWPRRIIDV
jgi:hypothetical protein